MMTEKFRTERRVTLGLCALILAAPSVFLLLSCDPFWMAIDGFLQVTLPLDHMKVILNYPPAYCFLTRFPLLLGAWGEGVSVTSWAMPPLTRTGVGWLIGIQHFAVWASLLTLVCSISKVPRLRVILAVFFASLSYFYTYAQTVGTEALSSICAIWLFLAALGIWRGKRNPGWLWAGYFVIFVAAGLARHINAAYAMLLPLAFLLQGGLALAEATWRGRRFTWDPRALAAGRRAALAIVLGVLGIALQGGIIKALSASAGVEYRTRAGFGFLWRLDYVRWMPEAAREVYVQNLKPGLGDGDIAGSLDLFRQSSGLDWLADKPYYAMITSLKALHGWSDEKAEAGADQRMNALMRFVIGRADPAYRAAVGADILRAFQVTPAAVAEYAPRSTQWLAKAPWPDVQAAIAVLPVGSKKESQEHTLPRWVEIYLNVWSWCPNFLLLGAFLLLCVAVPWHGGIAAVRDSDYLLAVSMVATGITITVLTMMVICVLERYVLPLEISLALGIAVLAECRLRGNRILHPACIL